MRIFRVHQKQLHFACFGVSIFNQIVVASTNLIEKEIHLCFVGRSFSVLFLFSFTQIFQRWPTWSNWLWLWCKCVLLISGDSHFSSPERILELLVVYFLVAKPTLKSLVSFAFLVERCVFSTWDNVVPWFLSEFTSLLSFSIAVQCTVWCCTDLVIRCLSLRHLV